MSNSNLIYWLMLEMVYGVGSTRLYDAVGAYESPAELFYSLHDPDNTILNDKERRLLRQTSKEKAESILEFCQKHGIGVMTKDDEHYPDTLRAIYHPPMVLFYRGDASLLHREPLLSVVGARRASDYSLRVTDYFCRSLARRNVIIASGGAVGIDAAAHWAAINEGKPTVAVLGCGVDYDYPKDNRIMREKILQNGLLLTEFFPGTQPYPTNFPTRNRILAGISEGTLVTEAGAKSGSLITANLACENGRHVFCVPPADIFDARYQGVVRLLRDGAIPAFDELDVVQELYQAYPHRLVFYDEEESSLTEDSQVLSPVQDTQKQQKHDALPAPEADRAEPPEAPGETPYTMPEDAIPEQRRILELLQKGRQNVNAICCLLEMPFEETSMLLMEMEMNGWIVNTERDIFALNTD